MKTIPADILARFSKMLTVLGVPGSLHSDYRKWLQYYLDFREKYPPPPSRSEHVRLFVQKLQDKKQAPEKLKQAAHAVSLFFQTEPRLSSRAEKQPALPSAGNTPVERKAHPAVSAAVPVSPAPAACLPTDPLLREIVVSSQQSGSRYNEWRCLAKTKSRDWDEVIVALAREIKTRHYSRKTLKTYADWSRKFQYYLNLPPFFRNASSAGQLRYPHHPGTAWPQRCQGDDDLYPLRAE